MGDNTKIAETQTFSRQVSGIDERFLVFSLCEKDYAVPLLKVREVIALGDITSIPNTSPFFKGVMNLRGQVISVIDLRVKFKMKSTDVPTETAIVILDLSPLCLGVIVDAVNSVLAIGSAQISPSPEFETSVRPDFISGVARVNKNLILILDIEKTLSVRDLAAIKEQKTA